MQFRDYLKQCRERNALTQEELVHALYSFNIEHFEGLDTTTVSKWERGVTKPSPSRQVAILKYFQSLSGIALPCWDNYTSEEAEEIICKVGVQNLLGNSKELVLKFPQKMMLLNDLRVIQARNTENFDKYIEMNVELDKGFNHRFTGLTAAHFKNWALHPSHTFYICEYKDQFFGLFFILRLKPESFEKIIRLEIMERDLTNADFATYDEPGSHYFLSFFALNEKAATMLFIRNLAHLIAHQKVIENVGVAYIMEDAAKLLKKMNFSHIETTTIHNGKELKTFAETLPNFLASEETLKTVLSKQECPET